MPRSYRCALCGSGAHRAARGAQPAAGTRLPRAPREGFLPPGQLPGVAFLLGMLRRLLGALLLRGTRTLRLPSAEANHWRGALLHSASAPFLQQRGSGGGSASSLPPPWGRPRAAGRGRARPFVAPRGSPPPTAALPPLGRAALQDGGGSRARSGAARRAAASTAARGSAAAAGPRGGGEAAGGHPAGAEQPAQDPAKEPAGREQQPGTAASSSRAGSRRAAAALRRRNKEQPRGSARVLPPLCRRPGRRLGAAPGAASLRAGRMGAGLRREAASERIARVAVRGGGRRGRLPGAGKFRSDYLRFVERRRALKPLLRAGLRLSTCSGRAAPLGTALRHGLPSSRHGLPSLRLRAAAARGFLGPFVLVTTCRRSAHRSPERSPGLRFWCLWVGGNGRCGNKDFAWCCVMIYT